jgi:photosystem II stability/assembly factor-like uncharacterized protein
MKLQAAVLLAMLALFLTVGSHPASGATLFGLVDTGEIYASIDGGFTWSVRSTIAASDAVGIAAAETGNELFLITRSGIVYRSTDAGVNWTAVGAVASSDVVDMLIRHNGDIFLLSRTGILWQSTDDGETFTAHSTLTASNLVSITADGSANLYVLTQTGEVARSVDEGATWNTVGVVIVCDAVEILAADSDLYVLTGTGDIARSIDQGVNWTIIGTISQVHMRSLTLSGDDLIATTSEGLITSSVDGTSWSWVGSINQLTVEALGNDTPSTTSIGPDGPPPITVLHQNYPNPFNPTTTIRFDLPRAEHVRLCVYNVKGELVTTIVDQHMTEGRKEVVWTATGYHGTAVASGIYFYRLVAGDFVQTRKMVLLR